MMRHAYYLPYQEVSRATIGDDILLEGLKELYDSFEIHKDCIGRYDGVSRYEKDGKIVTVIILPDFFNKDFANSKVFVLHFNAKLFMLLRRQLAPD